MQALPAVRELIPHCVVGECADLRKVRAVPGLHRGEAVASMGEGEHLAQAVSAVAVKARDVADVIRAVVYLLAGKAAEFRIANRGRLKIAF